MEVLIPGADGDFIYLIKKYFDLIETINQEKEILSKLFMEKDLRLLI
jgi:hypothetical protein